MENLPRNQVLIKADFIQNIAHSRGRETSQAYYGKRQTQFLCFVVWYWVCRNGVWEKHKQYYDFLSSEAQFAVLPEVCAQAA